MTGVVYLRVYKAGAQSTQALPHWVSDISYLNLPGAIPVLKPVLGAALKNVEVNSISVLLKLFEATYPSLRDVFYAKLYFYSRFYL